ncbi:helix-turn-helix domain-containing protein [Patescibacteria group bacterium]|nr:helix-turn-helix domain-containing protein [Patescibacteria group bacterium]
MEKDLDIAKKLKEVRMSKNLSQERFGYKIGKSGKTISAYESGRCTPTYKVLDYISQVYDVTFMHVKKSKKEQLKERLDFIKEAITDIENTFLPSIDEEK